MEKCIYKVIEQLKEPGQGDRQPILVQGTPSTDGEDGFFEWSEKCDPQNHQAEITEQEKQRAVFQKGYDLILNKY